MEEYDDRIVKYAPRGTHIALKCRNHPGMRWSTKNIAPIGCRSIFYDLMNRTPDVPECSCSLSCLIPLTEDEVNQS